MGSSLDRLLAEDEERKRRALPGEGDTAVEEGGPAVPGAGEPSLRQTSETTRVPAPSTPKDAGTGLATPAVSAPTAQTLVRMPPDKRLTPETHFEQEIAHSTDRARSEHERHESLLDVRLSTLEEARRAKRVVPFTTPPAAPPTMLNPPRLARDSAFPPSIRRAPIAARRAAASACGANSPQCGVRTDRAAESRRAAGLAEQIEMASQHKFEALMSRYDIPTVGAR